MYALRKVHCNFDYSNYVYRFYGIGSMHLHTNTHTHTDFLRSAFDCVCVCLLCVCFHLIAVNNKTKQRAYERIKGIKWQQEHVPVRAKGKERERDTNRERANKMRIVQI